MQPFDFKTLLQASSYLIKQDYFGSMNYSLWGQEQENVNLNSASGVRSQEENVIRSFGTKHQYLNSF